MNLLKSGISPARIVAFLLLSLSLITAGALTSNYTALAGAQSSDGQDLEQRISELENIVQNLSAQTTKIGYVNAEGAFTAFTEAVQEERDRARQKEQEIMELRNQLMQGEITKEQYQQQNDLLQAQRLKAQLAIDLAMIDKMIQAKGFQNISDRLKQVREQTKPVEESATQLVQDIEDGVIPPQEAQSQLQRINNQFQQLDQLLTQVIERKIMQVTTVIADEQNFDIVFRQKNVLMYRDSATISDLTGDVKQRLAEELQS